MLKSRIALIALVILLVAILPVYAQDATPEATPATSATAEATALVQAAPAESRPVAGVAEDTSQVPTNGATALVLLVGVGAIIAVGAGALIRATYQPPKE